MKTEVDMSSFKRTANNIVLWKRFTYLTPTKIAETDAKPTASAKMREIYDCNAGATNVTTFITYDEDNQIIANLRLPEKWQDVVPDSLDDGIINRMCVHKKPID